MVDQLLGEMDGFTLEDAQAALAMIRQMDPNKTKWNEAVDLFNNSDYQGALDLLSDIPPNAKVCFNMGMASFKLGQFDQAIEYFSDAASRDKFLAISFFQRGVCHHTTGNIAGAIVDYTYTLESMREAKLINYKQMGMNYHMHKAEVYFNRAAAWCSLELFGRAYEDLCAAIQNASERNKAHDVIRELHTQVEAVARFGGETFVNPRVTRNITLDKIQVLRFDKTEEEIQAEEQGAKRQDAGFLGELRKFNQIREGGGYVPERGVAMPGLVSGLRGAIAKRGSSRDKPPLTGSPRSNRGRGGSRGRSPRDRGGPRERGGSRERGGPRIKPIREAPKPKTDEVEEPIKEVEEEEAPKVPSRSSPKPISEEPVKEVEEAPKVPLKSSSPKPKSEEPIKEVEEAPELPKRNKPKREAPKPKSEEPVKEEPIKEVEEAPPELPKRTKPKREAPKPKSEEEEVEEAPPELPKRTKPKREAPKPKSEEEEEEAPELPKRSKPKSEEVVEEEEEEAPPIPKSSKPKSEKPPKSSSRKRKKSEKRKKRGAKEDIEPGQNVYVPSWAQQ